MIALILFMPQVVAVDVFTAATPLPGAPAHRRVAFAAPSLYGEER